MIMMMKWLRNSDVPSTNKLVSKNQRANESYQEVVSPEVSKTQGDQKQFFLEKRLEQRK